MPATEEQRTATMARAMGIVTALDTEIYRRFDNLCELSSYTCEELAVAAREAMKTVLEQVLKVPCEKER